MCKTHKRTERIDSWDSVNKCSHARDTSPHSTVALQVAIPQRCYVCGMTMRKGQLGRRIHVCRLNDKMRCVLYSGIVQLLDPATDRPDK